MEVLNVWQFLKSYRLLDVGKECVEQWADGGGVEVYIYIYGSRQKKREGIGWCLVL